MGERCPNFDDFHGCVNAFTGKICPRTEIRWLPQGGLFSGKLAEVRCKKMEVALRININYTRQSLPYRPKKFFKR